MNLIGILVAWIFSLDRPLIDGDYVVLALLAMSRWRHPVLLFVLALLLVCCEWFISISVNLFFFDWRDLLELTEGDAVPLAFIVEGALGVGLYLAVAAWIAWGRAYAKPAVAMALVGIVVFGVLLERGQRRFMGYSEVEANYVFFPAWMLAQKLASPGPRRALVARFTGQHTATLTPLPEQPKVYSALAAAAQDPALPETVMVLVESWGYENDAALHQLLQSSLLRKLGDRQVEMGTDASFGTTVFGEFRTLCSQRLNGVHVPREQISSDCIPQLFARNGATAKSFHGYSSRFYQRDAWYPTLGFDASFWKDSIPGTTCNYAFGGICDRDVLQYYAQQAEPGRRGFYYIVTLDTHLPVTSRAAEGVGGASGSFSRSGDYDIYMRLLARTLSAVGDIAVERPQAKIVVTGDHPPYLILNIAREHNIARDRVPYVIISPAAAPTR